MLGLPHPHPECVGGFDLIFDGPLEGFDVWVCLDCRRLEAICLHENNFWNEAGTVLTCGFCGLDVT